MDNAKKFNGYTGVVATRLREKMESTKTTQETLAKQIGLTRQTISQYMDGSVLPNAEKIYKICEYFQIPSDYLLGLTNSQKQDMSEQYIQDTLGLNDTAIECLKGVYQGFPDELFPIKHNIDAISYLLSNKDFIRKLLDQLFACWYELNEAEKASERTGKIVFSDELPKIKYALLDLFSEYLIEQGYEDFYKSVVLAKPPIKPGRRRKSDKEPCSSEEDNVQKE